MYVAFNMKLNKRKVSAPIMDYPVCLLTRDPKFDFLFMNTKIFINCSKSINWSSDQRV